MFEASDDSDVDDENAGLFALAGVRSDAASMLDSSTRSCVSSAYCRPCDSAPQHDLHALFTVGAGDYADESSDCESLPPGSPPAAEEREEAAPHCKERRGTYDRSDGKGNKMKWDLRVQRHWESIQDGSLAAKVHCETSKPQRCMNNCQCTKLFATRSLLEELAIDSFGEAVAEQDWASITPNQVACRRAIERENPAFSPPLLLSVRPSTIGPHVGDGLFVGDISLAAGLLLGYFQEGSQCMTREQFLLKYPDQIATHVAQIGSQYLDGTLSIWGKMNRAPRGKRNNVRLGQNGSLRISRTVHPFSELFLAYGNAYRIVPLPTSH